MKNPKTKIIFGILVALGFILYLAALGPRLKKAVVSPVVRCENHNAAAKVVRREERLLQLGESRSRFYRWWIVVTTPEGREFETWLNMDSSTAEYDAIKEQREISYELSWGDSGKSLTWSNSTGKEGTAYYTGNSVFYNPDAIMVDEKALPLTDEIKRKLQVHPDMMEASASLSGYVVLTDGFTEDVINLREDVLLLVQPDFRTDGTLISFGPVIFEDMATITEVESAKWVFLDGDVFIFHRLTAERVYVLDPSYLLSDAWKKDERLENCKEFILVSEKDLSEK